MFDKPLPPGRLRLAASGLAIAVTTGLTSCAIAPRFPRGIAPSSAPARSEETPLVAAPLAPELRSQFWPLQSPGAVAAAFKQAVDESIRAGALTEQARSRDDWERAIARWDAAIALLKRIPETNPQRPAAEEMMAEYARHRDIARDRAASLPETGPVPTPSALAAGDSPASTAIAARPETGALPAQLHGALPDTVARSAADSAVAAAASAALSAADGAQPSTDGAATDPGAIAALPPETALARHLQRTGATLYGTYWCDDCKRQLERFGAAASYLRVVECDPKGDNPQPDLCARASVETYPTWEIDGQLYPQVLSLREIAEVSAFADGNAFADEGAAAVRAAAIAPRPAAVAPR